MQPLTDELTQTVHRAAELTEELAQLLGVLRSATAPAAGGSEPSLVDTTVLAELIDGVGSTEQVVELVAGFANGLSLRGDRFLEVDPRDEALARRLLADLRSTSELLGATAVAGWCRRHAAGGATTAAELRGLIEATRRALTHWRLSLDGV
jgi:hypothetical protein